MGAQTRGREGRGLSVRLCSTRWGWKGNVRVISGILNLKSLEMDVGGFEAKKSQVGSSGPSNVSVLFSGCMWSPASSLPLHPSREPDGDHAFENLCEAFRAIPPRKNATYVPIKSVSTLIVSQTAFKVKCVARVRPSESLFL